MPTSVAGWQRNWARKCRPNSTSARGWTAIDDWQWLEDADASMIRAWHSRTICQRAHRSWKYSTWRSGDCERPKTSPILNFNFHWFNDSKDIISWNPPSGCYPAATPMLPPNLGCWGTLGNCSTSKKSWETTRLQPDNPSGRTDAWRLQSAQYLRHGLVSKPTKFSDLLLGFRLVRPDHGARGPKSTANGKKRNRIMGLNRVAKPFQTQWVEECWG